MAVDGCKYIYISLSLFFFPLYLSLSLFFPSLSLFLSFSLIFMYIYIYIDSYVNLNHISKIIHRSVLTAAREPFQDKDLGAKVFWLPDCCDSVARLQHLSLRTAMSGGKQPQAAKGVLASMAQLFRTCFVQRI